MASRQTNLDRPRDLRIVEDLDGFSCLLVDREVSRTMQRHLDHDPGFGRSARIRP